MKPTISPRMVAVTAIFVLAMTSPSYAYLDPGTASIILQSIVAAFAAAAATIGIYWNRVKALVFGRKPGLEAKEDQD